MSYIIAKCQDVTQFRDGYKWESEIHLAKIPNECVEWDDNRLINWCTHAGIFTCKGLVDRSPEQILVTDLDNKPILVVLLYPGLSLKGQGGTL